MAPINDDPSPPRDPVAPAEPGKAAPCPDAPEEQRPEGTTFWSWLRQTARLWGFIAFILIILIVFRRVILPFLLAVVVAYVLSPVLRFLCGVRLGRFRAPRFVWLILLYILVLGLQVFFFTSFVPRLSQDFKRILQEAPEFWSKAREEWVPAMARWMEASLGDHSPSPPRSRAGVAAPAKAPPPRFSLKTMPDGEVVVDAHDLRLQVVHQSEGTWLVRAPPALPPPGVGEQRIADAIDRTIDDFVQSSERRLNQAFRWGQVLLVVLLHAITTFILVLMISAFLLLDSERIMGGMRSLVPPRYYRDFDNVIALIDKGLSGAIRGQLLICLVNGVLTWVGLFVIGVKYAILLALLAGVMSLIPIFGSILSSIPIVVVALASGTQGLEPVKGGLILGWIIGIHLLEANLLNPKIIGTAAKIHPIIVIFAVVAGERTYGPIGALLGVPLVSAVQAVFIYLRQRVRGELTAPAGPPPGAP